MKTPGFLDAVDFLAGLPLALIVSLATMFSLRTFDFTIALLSSVIWYAGSRLIQRSVARTLSDEENNGED